MNKIQNKKSGFSMLELVVVMLIMGTLRGIRISKMGGSDTGRIKRSVKSDIRGVIASVNACYRDKLDFTQCDTTDELSPTPVLSPNNILAMGTRANSKDFPVISITNSELNAIDSSRDSITYDADTQDNIGTFN